MKKWILPLLTLLALLYIFSNSLAPRTEAEAKRQEVADAVSSATQVVTGEKTTFDEKDLAFLSKCFHVGEFALFSLFLSLHVRLSGQERGFERVLCCGAFCALADEQLQLIASERGARLSDVFVDLSGVMIGYAAAVLILFLIRRRNPDVHAVPHS